jgi:16S rRNA (guanine527-N7)-methyltransferase
MAALTHERLKTLLWPYNPGLSDQVLEQLSVYLDLLRRWNAKTNLSAIREPEEIVTRHFGESLFAAQHLPKAATLLDLGSGAGFPGLPIALVHPEVAVTLAESQNKKAAFLREAVRVLGLKTEVWASRVEELPANRVFDVVTLRAVDNPGRALKLARERLAAGGTILHFCSGSRVEPSADAEDRVVLAMPGRHSTLLECIR